VSAVDEALTLAPRASLLVTLSRLFTAPRFLVYCCCTLAALLTTYHLGKDMAWDTLDYHFYAGFSALHDRFGQDYFAAGPQSYLNPYIFVPFYLLASSGLTALEVGLVLAAVQSMLLWLVYELALAVAPPTKPAARLALALCAVTLALANPVLIGQLGSSFADVLTAEMVLAGWLLLALAARTPSAMRVVCAALVLGCASALKLTNALHAVSAGVMVLLIPGSWRNKVRHATLFVLAGAGGFAAVAAPWSIRLQQHFGNPFFPLFNGIFRSPQFTTARIIQYRFIPPSLDAALLRPFAMLTPRSMVHVEQAAPDLRYALLLAATALAALVWGWRRWHGNTSRPEKAIRDDSGRVLAALGLGFLVDWILWLTASGNSRYFIPMACVAAALAVALIFRFCSQWPKARNYLLLAVFVVQFYQLRYGTQYQSLPWDPHEPWFQVSVPKSLAAEPALYLSIGIQSDSFIAPSLSPGSGFINLEADYTLGPDGANGKHIEALITRYSPNLRMLIRDERRDAGYDADLPNMGNAIDALEAFGLQLDTSHCARIVVHGVSSPTLGTTTGRAPSIPSTAEMNVGYFITCRVVTGKARAPALVTAENDANLVFDRLEDACPALFQPRRPATFLMGDKAHGYVWARQYPNTDVFALIARGRVQFQPFLTYAGYAGRESAWQKAPLRLSCARGADGYFLRIMSSVECPATQQKGARSPVATLKRVLASPRFLVYVSCALLALATSYRLGKDMQWDTLDYHLYAGFSAIHDRFGLDYFAAAPQSYLNPYAYAPFYLLATSGLSALEVAGILAAIQSAILWLTYELASTVAPPGRASRRIVLGIGAALLAFANPVLMEQFGSSFADITTAELVLAGALLLVGAIRASSAWRVAAAGCLLGAASALKLTNSLDAISLAIIPLFLPVRWPKRCGCTALYGLSAALGFVLVSLPWSIQLERQFGNPLFPLLNGVFRSPEYTTAAVVDYRFIPASLAAALWRPFAMAAPVRVHFERPAPDLRYALLLVLAALLVLARWASHSRGGRKVACAAEGSAANRALLALGSAFLINWVIWLTLFGNSRYFIPMACVAAVLVMALACRLLLAWPRAFACVVAVILLAQVCQVDAGAVFRPSYPWAGEQWFDVSVPHAVAAQPALYFSVEVQSNSFVVPYLPAGSGFINVEGDYVLGPDGVNGARIRELIRRFAPHLRVLVLDSRVDAERDNDVPHLDNVDDAVLPFGLRVDSASCSRIVARATPKLEIMTVGRARSRLPASAWYTRYLVTCPLVPDTGRRDALASSERSANVVLDRLEDACPTLFQPRRPETYLTGSELNSYFWVRRYSNTDVIAWVHRGQVAFEKLIGGGRYRVQGAGSELSWENSPLRVVCGRRSNSDFLRILPPGR
jgi:hypothetical protein